MFALLTTFVVLVSMLAACAQPEPEVVVEEREVEVEVTRVVEEVVEVETKATRGGEIVVAMNNEPDSLDPHVSSSRYDVQVENAVYETLIVYDEEERVYKPHLATEWSVSDDGTEWTFMLRDDVMFHDGEPFNAEAVMANFERMMDPETKSESAVYQIGPIQEMEVVDEYTIKLTYDEPFAALLPGLVQVPVSMISPAAMEEYGQELYNNMVGTGPFKFIEWEERDHITIERWEDYDWAPPTATHDGPAYLEKVTYIFVPEGETRLATLMTGDSDIVMRVPEDAWPQMAGNANYQTASTPQPGFKPAIDLNTQKFPTDDINVRKALNYLIDKEAVIQAVYGGVYEPAYGMLSPYTPGYEPEANLYEFDPEQGMALLEEAGWSDTDGDGILDKDGEPLHLVYLTLPGVQETAVVIQALLEEYGISVEVLAEDNPAQQSDAQQGIQNMVWIQWGASDPSILRQMFGCENVGAGWNFSHYCDEEAQALMEAGEKATNPDERMDIYSELQIKLMEDAVTVPLRVYSRLWAYESNIENFRTQTGEYLEYYDLYIYQE
jgi:peptide/nickel transport system substrate-binding protein